MSSCIYHQDVLGGEIFRGNVGFVRVAGNDDTIGAESEIIWHIAEVVTDLTFISFGTPRQGIGRPLTVFV
jgi:hypothetical protein